MKSFFGLTAAPLVPSLAVSPTSSSPPLHSVPQQSPTSLSLSSDSSPFGNNNNNTLNNPLPPTPALTIIDNQTFFCGPSNELVYIGSCTLIHVRDSKKTPIVSKNKDEGAEETLNGKYMVPHGRGVLKVRYETNEKYIDEAINGGVIYSGNWSKGVRDGEGEGLVQTHTTRGYHGGWYSKDELTGGDVVVGTYKGEWKKGTLSGRGVLHFHNPPANARLPTQYPELRVQGEFLNDNPWHCIGSIVTPSGDWYSGEWVSGFFSGKTDKITSGNPLRYKGEVRNDKKHGSGEEIDPIGGRYIGYFTQDHRNFTGRFIWPSGRVEEREYNNGTLLVRTEVDPALQETLVKDMEEQLKASVAQVQTLSQELARTKAQIATLTSLVEVEKEANLCQICMENKRNSLIMPCCHFLYCNDCIRSHSERNANNCPACRTPIGGIMQCKLTLT